MRPYKPKIECKNHGVYQKPFITEKIPVLRTPVASIKHLARSKYMYLDHLMSLDKAEDMLASC